MSERPEIYEQKALGDPAALTALVRQVALETLAGIGLDVSSPTELQADLYYLRRLRKGGEEVRSVVRHSLLTLAVSTALYMLWEAVKGVLEKG
jgi:hypothetical protein